MNEFNNIGFTRNGTTYGESQVDRYVKMQHGPDGKMLLDPPIYKFLKENTQGKFILDAGCGAAPFAIFAALHGALVTGIDIQERMIEQGKKALLSANLSEIEVDLEVGDVCHLPYANKYFDKAISVNVGCNLPSSKEVSKRPLGLSGHLVEMARVLKDEGSVLIAAPSSLHVVFTSGQRPLTEVMKSIEKVLQEINNEGKEVISSLSSLTDVYSATFFYEGNTLKLLTKDNILDKGTKIWRKLPENVIPNYFHSKDEYKKEIYKAGFKIINVKKPKLTHRELQEFNLSHKLQLGEAYARYNPFIIAELIKLSPENSWENILRNIDKSSLKKLLLLHSISLKNENIIKKTIAPRFIIVEIQAATVRYLTNLLR